MKVLLHFSTEIGPRTVIAEIGDDATAQAVVNAHLAQGQRASVVEEMPRISLKDHVAKHRKAMAKAARAKAPALPANVTAIKARKRANG